MSPMTGKGVNVTPTDRWGTEGRGGGALPPAHDATCAPAVSTSAPLAQPSEGRVLTAREVRLLASDLVFTAHNGILDCRVEPLTRDVLELDLDVDQMRRVLQAVTWLAALLAEETPARARRAMVAFSEVNEQEGP